MLSSWENGLPPLVCSSPATQRLGGKDRSMISLEETEILTDVILEQKGYGKMASFLFHGEYPKSLTKNRACNKDTREISGGEQKNVYPENTYESSYFGRVN